MKTKVSYLSCWSDDGTHYSQTITVDKDIFNKFSNAINKEIIETKNTYVRDHLVKIKRNDLQVYYLRMTQLSVLGNMSMFKGNKRILDRNTVLIIK